MPHKRSHPEQPPAHHGRRFKPRALALGDGDSLVLTAEGSIARVAADGTTKETWAPGDAGWPGQAIRFGLRAPVATANPHDRTVRQEPLPRR